MKPERSPSRTYPISIWSAAPVPTNSRRRRNSPNPVTSPNSSWLSMLNSHGLTTSKARLRMPSRGPTNRRAGLAAQEAFKAWADGWETHHKGWPDFLCVHDGQVVAVEVKTGNAGMSAEQREVAAILATVGVNVYAWSPDSGLVEV